MGVCVGGGGEGTGWAVQITGTLILRSSMFWSRRYFLEVFIRDSGPFAVCISFSAFSSVFFLTLFSTIAPNVRIGPLSLCDLSNC